MLADLRRPERTFTIRQLCNEFKATPRALRFYEDKGLLTPAREGLNRVYSHKDRVRLQLILRGKRVGLSLSEIRELLDLYDENDDGAAQMARSLKKFRERATALEQQREDIDGALIELREACARLERRLAEIRPDLLPRAADYDQVLRARLDGHGDAVGQVDRFATRLRSKTERRGASLLPRFPPDLTDQDRS
jgi:DNA-binding transcriptional MerR regulator